jgi:hypothetical protein
VPLFTGPAPRDRVVSDCWTIASVNHPAAELIQMWRVSPLGRLGAGVVVGFWIVLSLVFTLAEVPRGVVLGAWLTTALIAVGAWRWAFVPFVALTAKAVVVQNRLRRTVIPYSDVADVQPGATTESPVGAAGTPSPRGPYRSRTSGAGRAPRPHAPMTSPRRSA